MALSRRTFIRTGIAGGVLLSISGWVTKGVFWGEGARIAETPDHKYHFLTNTDRRLLQRLTPVILAGALPTAAEQRDQAIEEVIRAWDGAVSYFLPAVQAEVRQLMSLLELAPTRIGAAGLWSSWSGASDDEIAAFLERWRDSRMELFQSAYDALVQLTMGSWYGNPSAWEGIGYPGPPPINQS